MSLSYGKAVVCMSVCQHFQTSNTFSETAGPIEARFHVEPPWDGGTKVCSRGPGHMTKMAAMPIYGKKNFQKSSLELLGRFPRNLVWGTRANHCSNDDPGMTLTYFRPRSNLVT